MEALAIIEVLGRNGEIRHRERLFALPAIIGRGFDADLMPVLTVGATMHF